MTLLGEGERRMLELLRSREGGDVAWDELCRATRLDRARAASALEGLLGSGYLVEERAGHGVRLVGEPEPFSVDGVSALAPRGFLSDVHVFGLAGSTNEIASRLAAGRPGRNAIILAEAQTSGKGRHRRRWFSPPGVGLWFSLVLWPDLDAAGMTSLGLVASIAVASAVRRRLSLDAVVKWPNDVLIGDRKVCGILSELGGAAGAQCAVVGIGINVNQREQDFPGSFRRSACSLRMHASGIVDRRMILRSVLEEMAGRYRRAEREGFSPFRVEWETLSSMLGQTVRVAEGRSSLRGTVLGVADSGALRICDRAGDEHHVLAGDIEILDQG